MDFSRRAAQSCSSSGTGAGATGISSPIRANEAMNAPPERDNELVKCRRPSNAPEMRYNCPFRGIRGIWGNAVKLRITPVLLDYRRLLADGQRLRCRAVTASRQSETPA